MIVVSIAELLSRSGFPIFTNNSALGNLDHTTLAQCGRTSLKFGLSLVVDFPQLDRLIIGGEHLQRRVTDINPLYSIDLLLDLCRFQIVEPGLVRLELSEVFVVINSRLLL